MRRLYRQLSIRGQLAIFLMLVVLYVVSPWLGLPNWDTEAAATALALGLAATAINLMLGYCGLLTLGAAFAMGTGAYGEGLANANLHWSLFVSAIAAVVASAMLATVLGWLLVRLPRFYFAVATLGMAVAFSGIVAALPNITGGASGLINLSTFSIGPLNITSNGDWYVLIAVVSLLVLFGVYRLTAGRTGRLLNLVKVDELAASTLGVSVERSKLVIFVVASTILAVSGALLYPLQTVFTPDQAGLTQSVQLLGMAAVGGLGFIEGGFIGAAVLTWVQAEISDFGNYELLIYGAVFLAVVFYLRPGIAGGLRLAVQWLWRRFKLPDAAVAELERERTLAGAGEDKKATIPPARLEGQGLLVTDAALAFGGVRAVNGVSIGAPRGVATGLIGANGAGKSTLLNLISGIEQLDDGSVSIDGDVLGRLGPAERARRGIARTFQSPRLVDELPVIDNILLGPEAAHGGTFLSSRRSERETRRAARQALEDADLLHLAGRRAGTLGSGERKFIELLRALASAPTVLLMDEPGVGLSAAELERLQVWLGELTARGTALLVVDHNMDFIGRLVDHVYVMVNGEVTEQGRPDEVEMVAANWVDDDHGQEVSV